MSLMWRLLSASAVVSLSLWATTQQDVVKFVQRGLSQNPMLKVYSVKVVGKQELPKPKGWEAYVVEFNIGVKRRNGEQNLTQRDILFVKGRYVAPDLVDIKTNRSMKTRVVLNVDKSFYNEEHHIFGNKNAKHKIVVFSDPLCPFCRETVPKLFEVAKKYPDTFALYYYHLPLKRLHPASVALAKAIIYLKRHGNKKAIEKIYKTEFDYAEHNESKTLQELEKKLGLKLTKEQINQPEIINELKSDEQKAMRLMVRGTPTLYFDGKLDRSRSEYKKYIPKK